MSVTVTALVHAHFTGIDTTSGYMGPWVNVSVPGVKVGDFIIAITKQNGASDLVTNAFNLIVASDDNVQQSNGIDLSANTYDMLLVRIP